MEAWDYIKYADWYEFLYEEILEGEFEIVRQYNQQQLFKIEELMRISTNQIKKFDWRWY